MQKSYLGNTKLYNYSKVKDPKNPPDNEAFPELNGGRGFIFLMFFLDSKLVLMYPTP
jgi:hypothetical protein